jgi:hypothetical protein
MNPPNKYQTPIPSRDCGAIMQGLAASCKETHKSLVIAEWSTVKNWADVLSRVKKIVGLFLMKYVPEDINFLPAND